MEELQTIPLMDSIDDIQNRLRSAVQLPGSSRLIATSVQWD
jgi:hypothetical protein